ncbi:MAG: hypothetical protein A2W25_12245 [candidate division Zixibacteria bacterium RBG_16_53_22]|nr:MAG: hypothetical protein A2W25_12245 [candidate division Zixibacteria bacterium RBG_16_53_22]
MECMQCGGIGMVTETREMTLWRRRRRRCASCGCSWTTYEVHEHFIGPFIKMMAANRNRLMGELRSQRARNSLGQEGVGM